MTFELRALAKALARQTGLIFFDAHKMARLHFICLHHQLHWQRPADKLLALNHSL